MVNPINSVFMAIVCLTTPVVWAQAAPQQESTHAEAGNSVSFEKDVAPIIASKCGKCHVSNSRGEYGIASYDALMKSKSITPNDPAASSFIEAIESGEMPKSGPKVSDAELETLKNWIAQGAKYDGDNKAKLLIEPGTGDASQTGRGSQRGRRNSSSGGSRLQAVEKNPQAVGDEGIAWYVTWETGLAEAKRSNRPIFFMSAAAQCSGVSGVF